MKKICFITTTRADFGTLNELINEAEKNNKFKIQLIVSGSHTSDTFGKTEKEIKNKKRYFIKKIYIKLKNKNPSSVAISFSSCVKQFSETLSKTKPDLFVAFGDRYEMLAAALSAYILRIPIIHIAGGEKTSGSLDDGFRHAISKLSCLHFPTMEVYKKRLIQLGENPKTVFNFGSLNLLKIRNNQYLSKKELEQKLKFKFGKKNLIVTYHPETIDYKKSITNLNLILKSLKKIKNTLIIITAPNADAQGALMIESIKKFIKKNKVKNFKFYNSLGSQVYLSLLKVVDGVVGNSSSGISEVPYFGKGTVNIGSRQDGRFMTQSIINCKFNEVLIINSIKKILNNSFKNELKVKIKKNSDSNTAKKIIKKILLFDFKKYNNKIFYDIQYVKNL